ncbi:molybdenum cofactor guanylyltransferase [Acetobacter orleanensis]|nr:molybdenum cofactor guanylyltransferase [Acetobacter orleanensis]PCD79028.1 molybdenum cofactor guanylyltransferase [Acetobacter orleanensis]GBR27891.1 molybdopterin-guanine dinucleotide biosynthesis protein A [Acetobacter orleanensis NRIC 0473]
MSAHLSSPRIAALVLAGGTGSRMGGCDKTLLPLSRTLTVLDYVLYALRPHCAALAISANGDASRFAPWNLPVLSDMESDTGPLAGILEGLRWAEAQNCSVLITVPGDTPFIPADLPQRLLPAPAVAVSANRHHHLVASWPTSCRSALEAWLSQPECKDKRRIRAFAATLGMRSIVFPDQSPDLFFNINTPDEYAYARTLAYEGLTHA